MCLKIKKKKKKFLKNSLCKDWSLYHSLRKGSIFRDKIENNFLKNKKMHPIYFVKFCYALCPCVGT